MNQRILSYSSFLAIMVPPNLGGHLTDLLNANCGDKGPSSGLHITLLDPFFEPEHFEASTNEMRELLQNIEPFEISLDEYGHFSKKNGSILWVKPHSTVSIRFLKLFSFCPSHLQPWTNYKRVCGDCIQCAITLLKYRLRVINLM
eukprot:TRINITY_DN6020_c0_g1_i2.p1 TRINITY_DN6020_c0_g1~~TRINITY_DN6020_c0_g1_i2.p1  ORF type:complete len:145 (-),score=6.68 TRINITY_DN6020_c0_g1_i2:233-667(-)